MQPVSVLWDAIVGSYKQGLFVTAARSYCELVKNGGAKETGEKTAVVAALLELSSNSSFKEELNFICRSDWPI